MSNYRIKKLNISNFKYIGANNPLIFDFDNYNLTILDGQNGYGKTTLFDAIELLINGSICHFSGELQARGKLNEYELANDKGKNIIISAEISDDDEEFIIKRVIGENTNELFHNGSEITQDELYKKLNISKALFNIGTYISQTQSLSFLQNKFKQRGETISNLINFDETDCKVDQISQIRDKLIEQINDENGKLVEQVEIKKNQLEVLQEKYEKLNYNNEDSVKYQRLFGEVDYPFDQKNLSFTNDEYQSYIETIDEIIKFLQMKDLYIAYLHNLKISKVLNFSTEQFKAVFFQKQVVFVKENENVIRNVSECQKFLSEVDQGNWANNKALFLSIGISEDTVNEYSTLLNDYKEYKHSASESAKVLHEFTIARKAYISTYRNKKPNQINDNVCPLCGSEFEDINIVFDKVEKMIQGIDSDSNSKLEQMRMNLYNLYKNAIEPRLNSYVIKNTLLIKNNISVAIFKDYDVTVLKKMIEKWGVLDFESTKDEVTDEEFYERYNSFVNIINDKRKILATPFSQKDYQFCEYINNKYNLDPFLKKDIDLFIQKKNYINQCYFNNMSHMLVEINSQYELSKKKLDEFSTKSSKALDIINTIQKKYKVSMKEFKQSISESIKLPLFIYSGKIIQNYPLGLGIKANVNNMQLTFEAPGKEGVDVYNMLSAGQLNGLAIAILLAIKSVYFKGKRLNVLLIDDPLQTIDDISAISLADLLCNINVNQIVMSTHENSKSNLLKYKFEQNHLDVKVSNMQKLYIENQSKV